MSWTPTRAARLGYLVGTLVPIERIAAEFGVTERAVWDKINRYGLSFHEAWWARHPGQAVPPVLKMEAGGLTSYTMPINMEFVARGKRN